MSPKIILYGVPISPPVRSVMLTLKALNLDYELKEISLADRSPDYLKKNPQNTMPTLEDDGVCLTDSHAICAYLVRKYGKDDSLYPKDYYLRAVVDQRLHYENSIIFMKCVRASFKPIAMGQITKAEAEEMFKVIRDTYSMLNTFLTGHQYIACTKNVTIADLCTLSSVSSLNIMVPIEKTAYPNVYDWLQRMQKLSYYDEILKKSLQDTSDRLLPNLAALK